MADADLAGHELADAAGVGDTDLVEAEPVVEASGALEGPPALSSAAPVAPAVTRPLPSLAEAIARLPAETRQALEDELRGKPREVVRYRPSIAID